MFQTLLIRHFKSIEQTDIELGDINIFVGNNGSGKSNIIDAIRFLKDVATNGLDRAISDRHGVESVRQWSPTRPYRIGLTVTAVRNDDRFEYTVGLDSAKGLFQVAREEAKITTITGVYFDEDEDARELEYVTVVRNKAGAATVSKYTLPLTKSEEPPSGSSLPWNQNAAREEETLKIDSNDEVMLNIRSYHPHVGISILRRLLSDFQAYSIYPNTLRNPQEPSSETFLSPEGRNLGSVVKRMRRTKRGVEALNLVTEALKSIHPGLERISILSVGGYLVPQFHMIEPSGKRHIFNVSQMSDGTLRVLGLLVALYQEPRNAVIALEEPEQTVNPAILTVIADAIKEVSKRSQILVTTHSPHLLDQFDPADVRSVELHDGKTVVGPVSSLQLQAVRDRLFSLGELLISEGVHS
jgi:predicted ATPase